MPTLSDFITAVQWMIGLRSRRRQRHPERQLLKAAERVRRAAEREGRA